MNGKYFIYFYYDKDGTLLYIGQAIDVWARWNGHNEPWKKDVYKIGVYECPDHAAMDILESFYIAKMPTKYNKAKLAHGYTNLEIPDLEEPKLYSVKEFSKIYRPTKKGTTAEPLPPIEEQITALGNTIIEIDGFIDFYDEKLLELDLDRVYFKYKNWYLASIFSPKPRERIMKKTQNLAFRTNECIRTIKQYLNDSTFKARVENGIIHHSFEITATSTDDCMKFFKRLERGLFSLYEVDTYWRGEKLSFIGGFYPQSNILWGTASFGEERDGVWGIDIEFMREEDLGKQPQISATTFSYDIDKLYAELIEKSKNFKL